MTITGAGYIGAAAIGTVVSGVQYLATSHVRSETPTVKEFVSNLGAGAIAGVIGGTAKTKYLFGFTRTVIAGTISPYISESLRKGTPYFKKVIQTLNPLNDPLTWGERY